jgi:CO dehydrogenase/acetyl-CoA synthase epsilon subunit
VYGNHKKWSKEIIQSREASIGQLKSRNNELEASNGKLEIELGILKKDKESLLVILDLCSRRAEELEGVVKTLQDQRLDHLSCPESVKKIIEQAKKIDEQILELAARAEQIDSFEEITQDFRSQVLEAEDRADSMIFFAEKYYVLDYQFEASEKDRLALRERFAAELAESPLVIDQDELDNAEQKLHALMIAKEKFLPLALDKDWTLKAYDAIRTACDKPFHPKMLTERKRVIRGIHFMKKHGKKIPKELLQDAKRLKVDLSKVSATMYPNPERWYPLTKADFDRLVDQYGKEALNSAPGHEWDMTEPEP